MFDSFASAFIFLLTNEDVQNSKLSSQTYTKQQALLRHLNYFVECIVYWKFSPNFQLRWLLSPSNLNCKDCPGFNLRSWVRISWVLISNGLGQIGRRLFCHQASHTQLNSKLFTLHSCARTYKLCTAMELPDASATLPTQMPTLLLCALCDKPFTNGVSLVSERRVPWTGLAHHSFVHHIYPS